jgi:hypothetical protein
MGPAGPAGSATGFTHWVGEFFGGGIVFHVYKDALGTEHGLICSLTSWVAAWGLVGITVPNARSNWNGASNTAAIIAAGVQAGSAAQVCDSYETDGFSDWYLPALDELLLLKYARYNVDRSLSQIPGATLFYNGVDGFQYLTSTEIYSSSVFTVYFNHNHTSYSENNTHQTDKTSSKLVRAVRSF